MQTRFTPSQLADPDTAESEQILRKCVHCGFCTATCPTYVLLGDELDSPRGRIYLIKDMLENDRPATAEVVQHIDRCLSCLACMTTCPSGVHYQHLVDHARMHVEKTYQRPWVDRFIRSLLAGVLPYPKRFRLAIRGATLGRAFARFLPARLRSMLDLAPRHLPEPLSSTARIFPARGERRMRVGLLMGCVQSVLDPKTHAASIRLLTFAGAEVVLIEGCCGAIVHHLGRAEQTRELGRRLIDAILKERDARGLDAVVVNASGCGTHLKDYVHVFRTDPQLASRAAEVSALAKDITEVLAGLDLPEPTRPGRLTVAYHSACSLQHGQKVNAQPRELLKKAGYVVREIPEGHLCCGSAGTYNLLQPEIARELRARKLMNIRSTGADVVAAGNIGCIVQLADEASIPVCHTVELLDRAWCAPEAEKRTTPAVSSMRSSRP